DKVRADIESFDEFIENTKAVFSSGAVRSSKKPRYDLIGSYFLKRIADVWEKGLVKYGEGNWKLGVNDPGWNKDLPNHIIEHMYRWLEGDRSEDHLANMCCNIQMLMYKEYLDATKTDDSGTN